MLQLPAQPMTASEAEFRSGPPSLVKQKRGFCNAKVGRRARRPTCAASSGCELARGPGADRHGKVLIIIRLKGSNFGA